MVKRKAGPSQKKRRIMRAATISGTRQGIADVYVHGYSKGEQARLFEQARFFESSIYEKVDFSKTEHLLEVGCGVGAQTEILLERFPHLQITGVDASKEQLSLARTRLKKFIKRGQVKLHEVDALNLPFQEGSFDGVFLCWFLEHVQRPIEILRETRRVLKEGGKIFCNEPLHATFFVDPYSPSTLHYWYAFVDYQWLMKGDPFVGAKLANYLMAAGFQDVKTWPIVIHLDNRSPKKRAHFFRYWTALIESGAPALLKAGKVTPELVAGMKDEFEKLQENPESVAFYAWSQASAQAL